ncbi:YkoF family thiamine/hydroxymethylpyrimidine-binding protein [Aliidiomarina celeris]|uniref:YkoF family thiamine/hydroxymethylpyrimidine-binding protein n=1 Tax=Aliidiomarina celeris TaxID=2249428 RepID=UPI000DE860E8|nr:YkoF family thiamine/hydroxymethylpyrimidine-binding protein [Aliidiomarina celeris]
MELSAELSLYPLVNESYKAVIKEFIEKLQADPRIEVHSNTMSTQVFGSFENVMAVLTQELEILYRAVPQQVLVCKFINTDLRP